MYTLPQKMHKHFLFAKIKEARKQQAVVNKNLMTGRLNKTCPVAAQGVQKVAPGVVPGVVPGVAARHELVMSKLHAHRNSML